MTKKKQPETAQTEARVYVGQSLPGLPRMTVFRGDGYPPHVAELIEKNEAVKGLIVPVSQLAEAVRDVKTKGNILHTYALKLERMNRRS